MARAKRTVRTDARRRHRAEQAALEGEVLETSEAADTAGNAKPAKGAPPVAGAKPAQQRPGFTTLMKQAYRPVRIVDDLKALPEVLINPGFLIAVFGSIAIAVWFVISYNTAVSAVPEGDTAGLEAVVASYSIPFTLMQLAIVSPPPAIGAFLIGFMAKRASWLGGLIYGIVTVIILILVLQQPAGRIFTYQIPLDTWIVQAAAWNPVGAALFAAAAAWYKRFLNMSNPNRAARQEQQKKQERKPQGRGDVKPNYRSGSR